MGKDTSIKWTNSTLNFGWGCRKVDAACSACYMFRMSKAFGRDPGHPVTYDISKREKELNSWPAEKRLVFVNDMSDTFGEFYSFELIAEWHEFFARHPEREFQLLTKRIGRALVFYRDYWKKPIPANVWIGCSIGEKSRLFRIAQLKQVKALGAKIVYISFEPLIEDLGEFSIKGVDWAIVGGESGMQNPRPMEPEWAESIRRICKRDGVAYYFKQSGGKGRNNAGGELLNGKEYREYPVF